MKSEDNVSYEIKSAENGFIIERSWKEVLDNAKPFEYDYKNSKTVFTEWTDVVDYLRHNPI